MKALSVIAATLLLAGCNALPPSALRPPHDAFATGWRAILHRPLTIPADAATVRLQYGRIVPRNGVQEHDPYCVVELDTVSPAPQVLRPGRFEVVRVTRRVETIATLDGAYRKAVFGFHDTGPSFLYYKTEFVLRDRAQPALRGMTCAWDQMAPGHRAFMRHLRLDEIRDALGDWMTLAPATGGA